MHQQHIRDVAIEQGPRHAPGPDDLVLGRLQIATFQPVDRGLVAPGHAARVGLVEGVVAEAHGHLGDAIATRREESAGRGALVGRLALGEEGKAQPAPVPPTHQRLEQGLVLDDVCLPGFQRLGVQVEVGPRVVRQGKSRLAPRRQHGLRVRLPLLLDAVDEPVDLGSPGCLQGRDDPAGHVGAGHAGRQSAVGRQVVEGERDLPRARHSR